MSLETMIRQFLAAQVDFVVIGGVAAQMHGSARITLDLDICYDPTDTNRARLVATLQRWDAYLRGADAGLPFILDERMLRNTPVMTLTGSEGAVDVMDRVAGLGGYDKVKGNSAIAEWGDLRFRILSLDALIAAKRATGRRKDEEAVLELEALREKRRRR